jgi:Spy/CpxP family protein refolding chaperone
MNWKLKALVAAAAAAVGATALAQQTQPPQEPPAMGQGMMGPGMMGGQGPGDGPGARGYGPGHGPGGRGAWVDDDDGGWGMMGGRGWGMGPGMMGMMGGYGMGPGMMGGMGMMGPGLGPIARLDLDGGQRAQVLKIEDDLRRRNWDVMGKMQDEMAKMRDAWWSGKRDRAAILAAYKRMSDLRLTMLENSLDARDRAEALLTPQQRDQLRRFGPN